MIFKNRKKQKQKPEDFFGSVDFPELELSEEMIRRDNFFHSCWMHFKLNHPDQWAEMTKSELFVAGYDPEKEPAEGLKDNEEQGTVL